jgi:hypothetical protein
MEHLNITQCRKLIGQPARQSLADDEVVRLRDMLYTLGDVIADVFADLHASDWRAFNPPNDLDDWLFNETAEGSNVN